jgi:hypothetical protein
MKTIYLRIQGLVFFVKGMQGAFIRPAKNVDPSWNIIHISSPSIDDFVQKKSVNHVLFFCKGTKGTYHASLSSAL